MKTTENPPRTAPSSISAEALIGTGVTIASVGGLFLLLGWAQWMRQVPDAAVILLIIGAVLTVGGIIVSMMGRGKRDRR